MSYFYDERPSSSDGRTFRPRNYHDYGRRSRDPSPVSFRQASARLQPDGRFYSNRFSYPISQPLTKVTNSAPKRQSWPPSPAVEDECEALAKEANAPKTRTEKDDAQSRGTVDQLPIILDVPDEAAKALERMGHLYTAADPTHDGPSTGSSSDSTQTSTPPKSDQGTNSRGRSRTPPSADFVDPPLLYERQASPYVFTPKAPPVTSGKFQDSGYFSSRDMKTPVEFSSPLEKRSGSYTYSGKSMSDALRGQGKPYITKDKLTGRTLGASAEHDEAVDSATDDESSKAIPDRQPARYSSVRPDVQGDELRKSLREMMAKNDSLPRVAALKAETFTAPRRSSDGAGSLPRPFLQDQSRKPAHLSPFPARSSSGTPSPLITPLNTAVGAALASAYERRDRSCPASPTNGHPSMPISPPRSPRGSVFNSKQISPQNGSSSRPGSRPSSRPSSPSSSEHSRYDDPARRTPIFPQVLDDRSQRTSRLASSILPPDSDPVAPRINVMSPSPVRPPKPTIPKDVAPNPLPYPTDDAKSVMPSEEQHRYDPSRSIAAARNPKLEQDAVRSPHGSPPSSVAMEPKLPSRPNLVNRHTYTEGLPTAGAVLQLIAPKDETARGPQSPVLSLGSIRPCPRMQYSRDFDDWHVLDGLQGFNFCPSCVQANFSDPRFRDFFRRSPRNDRNVPVKCNFGSPWMRVAWILTKQQNRTDLKLFYTVANVQATEKLCPGTNRDSRTWYTVLNSQGETVANFDVCSGDVKMVEELLFTLRGIFVRGYSHSRRRMCDFRVDSKRFNTYLDVLIDINDRALRSRTAPDLQPFIELAGKRAQTPECTRDDLTFDRCWHIMPQLPEFTVCEECYTDIVWPAIASGSSLASCFNRTPLLVAERDRGTSCQLYSDRMRHVFRKAVRHGDIVYLAQRVKERKGIEMELQAEVARVQQYLLRSEDRAPEITRITAEWKKWE